ncbi:MAG: carbohydrate binding family 9 domain-containing protein [candidate division WOR-3 bacterium]|nr:MAG: carbohydrate binding family 9 domain-containing protein [candidate division WOR-3 bacterium]
MHLLLLFFLTVNNNPTVEVRFTEVAPRIDGVIEDIWYTADSVYKFVQFMPYEKAEPTERTVVYVLQDEANLYVAFRCYAEKHKPTAVLTADEDDVRIGLDTFGSKTTAYYFQVFASGIFHDGWILDDGRTFDDSWEGVWYRAVMIYDDRFEVEIKIPFKSIRYKKGLSEWGVVFARYIAFNREYDLSGEFLQQEDVLISKYGSLTGINPQTTGYYFELYPEGYVRRDWDWLNDTADTRLSLSLNFKWDVTPQATINATVFPDFAQIESDPFELNLSRYPTYLDERRPFFLEGKDIFRMADFGGWGFFDPLEIFYSRRIGKSVNDDAVPIIGGLKLTNQTKEWNVGVLGAYTDEFVDSLRLIEEPRRWFGVVRARRSLFENSDIGILFSGSMVNSNTFNYALGIDGAYRSGANQFVLQGAVSDRNEKRGWAFNAGYFGYIKNFITFASAQAISDSFDVTDVGFVPWAGQKKLFLQTGPYKQFQKGFVRDFFIAPGIEIIQEPGDSNWSIVGRTEINTDFRNDWGFDFNVAAGSYYEADTNYFYRRINLSTWGRLFGNHLDLGCDYRYTYNYQRRFLAYQGENWLSYTYSIIPQIGISLASYLWIEWDPDNTIVAIWPMFRPRVDVRFNADMMLTIFNEMVSQTPGTDFGEVDLLSNRFGLLFSWNFMPKSWLYIALNDHRVDLEGPSEPWTWDVDPFYRIGAIKAKYLIYF